MTSLISGIGLLVGLGLGAAFWMVPLRGAIRVHHALKAQLATASVTRFDEGFDRGANLARSNIAARLSQLPPLACGRDPHLRLSEVLAIVRGDEPVVKRRRVKAETGGSIAAAGVAAEGVAMNAAAPEPASFVGALTSTDEGDE